MRRRRDRGAVLAQPFLYFLPEQRVELSNSDAHGIVDIASGKRDAKIETIAWGDRHERKKAMPEIWVVFFFQSGLTEGIAVGRVGVNEPKVLAVLLGEPLRHLRKAPVGAFVVVLPNERNLMPARFENLRTDFICEVIAAHNDNERFG